MQVFYTDCYFCLEVAQNSQEISGEHWSRLYTNSLKCKKNKTLPLPQCMLGIYNYYKMLLSVKTKRFFGSE